MASFAWKAPEEKNDENGNSISPSEILRMENTTKFIDLKDHIFIKIFQRINYSDLIHFRLINHWFNKFIIKSELFLASTVMVVDIKPNSLNKSPFPAIRIPYQNIKIKHLDNEVYLKKKEFDLLSSQNFRMSPSISVVKPLKSLEFDQCFITWDTIKKVISEASNLQHFSLKECIFFDRHRHESSAVLGEFNEFRVGETVANLKSIRIQETQDLKSINRIMEKLSGFSTRYLEKLSISFYPVIPRESHPIPEDREDLDKFCNLLCSIIEVNISTLRSLHLDLKCEPLLNIICPNVFGEIKNMWPKMKLEEFVLSPPGCTPSPKPVDMTQNTLESAEILISFLESQIHLKKVAIPHLRYMVNGQEKDYREQIASSLPTSTEYLCIPNQEYLTLDFLLKLPNLKKLYIGGSTSDDGYPIPLQSKMFDGATIVNPPSVNVNQILGVDLTKPKFPSERNRGSYPSLDNIRELGFGSSIMNGIELTKILRQINYLVKLEITSTLPVVQDHDLQCCIRYMPCLQQLVISSSEFLTDYGISGIPRNTCEMMVRLNNYHDADDSIMNISGNPIYSLSELKGLKHLILMGKSHITDVGIHFGLRFSELTSGCLPYNENITEWGIQQFGKHNPSLESFVCWGLNKRSRDGFNELIETHLRIKRHNCTFLTFKENEGVPNDISASLVQFEVLKSFLATKINGMCTQYFSWLFGVRSGDYSIRSRSSSTFNILEYEQTALRRTDSLDLEDQNII